VAEVVAGTQYIATVHTRSAEILSERLPLRVLAPPVTIAPYSVCLQWNAARATDPGMIWMKQFLAECGQALPPMAKPARRAKPLPEPSLSA
jgi:LysR family transcriptional regulator, nod-box dependent transcriptional activator